MFLEGYLFDEDAGKTAFREAARAAKAGGGMAGITISDPFCVERHRADFLQMIEHELDFVIGNEAEIKSLFETEDLEDAMSKTAAMCPIMVCTRGGDGVTLIRGTERVDIAAPARIVPVDATGAGDQFAAGFLYGFTEGKDLETCGKLGALSAAEVIAHIGPRPEIDYSDLIAKAA